MARVLTVWAAVILALWPVASGAQVVVKGPSGGTAPETAQRPVWPNPSDALVKDVTQIAADHIGGIALGDGRMLDENDRDAATLPDADAFRVVRQGVISVHAEWCGLDWQGRSYQPFMRSEQKRKNWSEKQMVYIGLLHSATMQAMEDALHQGGVCTSEVRDNITRYLF